MNWWIIILVILAAFILYFADKASLFTPVKIIRKKYPKLQIVYTTAVGAYKDAYKSNSLVESYLKEKTGKDYTMEPCIGLYYDNPKETKEEECRAVVGKIVDDNVKVDEDPSRKIGVTEIEITDSVTIEFPFKSVLSIIPSIMRAYPATAKYMKENNLEQSAAPIEFYGYPNGILTFVTPLGKYDGILTTFPKLKSE